MTDQLPATAQQLAERGIAESHAHAEGYDEGWTERAVERVRRFAQQEEYFLAEQVKAWAYEDGLAVPPVDGAWGQVMRTAAERGIVHRYGRRAATSPGSHGKLMTLWRRGPGSIAAPPITAKMVEDDCRVIREVADFLAQQGRSMSKLRLLEVQNTLRALSSDVL